MIHPRHKTFLRLLLVAIAASAMVAAATTAMWVRSYHVRDIVMPFKSTTRCRVGSGVESEFGWLRFRQYSFKLPFDDPSPESAPLWIHAEPVVSRSRFGALGLPPARVAVFPLGAYESSPGAPTTVPLQPTLMGYRVLVLHYSVVCIPCWIFMAYSVRRYVSAYAGVGFQPLINGWANGAKRETGDSRIQKKGHETRAMKRGRS
jgi:hypothetical protein